MIKYKQSFINGYTVFEFDCVFLLDEIIFESDETEFYHSIDRQHYTRMNGNIVNEYIKYIKVFGNQKISYYSNSKGYMITEATTETNSFRPLIGWTGADGVYNIELENKIYWYFSDTFIGEVNEKTRLRDPGFVMINNSTATSSSNAPFNIKYDYKIKGSSPVSTFESKNEGYFWLQDNIVVDDNLYIFALNVRNDETKWFDVYGVKLIKIKIKDKKIDFNQYEIINTSLLFNLENVTYTFGCAVITENEYTYIFGYDNAVKRNLVCIRTKSIEDSNQYEYLLEDGYSNKFDKPLKSLLQDVACEMKVIKDDGLYKLVFTKGSLSSDIYISDTTNIQSGFNPPSLLYRTTTLFLDDTVFTYNSKLHKFSFSDDLYVSYNVNTFNDKNHINAEIYYPRFIKLKKVCDKHE